MQRWNPYSETWKPYMLIHTVRGLQFDIQKIRWAIRNCYLPATGRNCMTQRQALQYFHDTSQASLNENKTSTTRTWNWYPCRRTRALYHLNVFKFIASFCLLKIWRWRSLVQGVPLIFVVCSHPAPISPNFFANHTVVLVDYFPEMKQ
jgi:hypothetical protein